MAKMTPPQASRRLRRMFRDAHVHIKYEFSSYETATGGGWSISMFGGDFGQNWHRQPHISGAPTLLDAVEGIERLVAAQEVALEHPQVA